MLTVTKFLMERFKSFMFDKYRAVMNQINNKEDLGKLELALNNSLAIVR